MEKTAAISDKLDRRGDRDYARSMDPFRPYQPKPRQAAPGKLGPDDAEAVAFKAVAFIVSDEDHRDRFLALTGCAPDQLRGRLADRGFQIAALEYLLGDEQAVLAFAETAELHPDLPRLAHHLLGG